MHWKYLIHEFHNLSWITEINELFHDIIIYWDAFGAEEKRLIIIINVEINCAYEYFSGHCDTFLFFDEYKVEKYRIDLKFFSCPFW